MPMYARIKISKRVKDKLPMVQPGTRDNTILPASGNSMSSGLSLDYSALNLGGIDNGVPFNHADDKLNQEPIWIIDAPGLAKFISNEKTEWESAWGPFYSEYELAKAIRALKLNVELLGDLRLKPFGWEHYLPNLPIKPDQIEVNKTDDPYNDDNKGRGSYVGTKEEGFEFRHSLDSGSTVANLTAVIIKGNVKYVKNNPKAEAFYNDISSYLIQKGYKVSFDSAESTILPAADLRIGHSKGLNKLNLCKNERAKLLAIGALPEKSKNTRIIFENHPVDEQFLRECSAGLKFDIPIDEHYIFTNAMKKTIDRLTDELKSQAFPDYPQYSDPEMYTQVSEHMPATPSFNLFDTYYADDVKETKELLYECAKCEFSAPNTSDIFLNI
jgi:hypothetical protein